MLKSIPKKFTVVSRKFVISNSRQYWPVVDSVEMTWTERANDEQLWKMERSFYSWFVTKVFGFMSWWHLTSLLHHAWFYTRMKQFTLQRQVYFSYFNNYNKNSARWKSEDRLDWVLDRGNAKSTQTFFISY